MKIQELIKGFDVKLFTGDKKVNILGLSQNSRQVERGYLYIAKKGLHDHGGRYVHQALSHGAVAIMNDRICRGLHEQIVQLISSLPFEEELDLIERFYGKPYLDLFMTGITGTNGKTTTAYLIHHLMQDGGLIGTNAFFIRKRRFAANSLTTPDTISCYQMLQKMVVDQSSSAVMEVTSHALHQNRVGSILYDAVVWTNVTSDHLDYHSHVEGYFEAKMKVLCKLKSHGKIVINNDMAETLLSQVKRKSLHPIVSYGIKNQSDFMATHIQMNALGMHFLLKGPNQIREKIFLSVIGDHNIYNVLAAIVVYFLRWGNLKGLSHRLAKFPGVSGRLERVFSRKCYIFVDFAHTEDALKNVLLTLRKIVTGVGKLITVFGCGGNRDSSKRLFMGRVAEKYSDFSIITTDNPRDEDPLEIVKDIQRGFVRENYLVRMDRKKAITDAIMLAGREDIVLIAGRGDEVWQIFHHDRAVWFHDATMAHYISQNITEGNI